MYFFAINNLELIDALDQSKTEYKYFEGELMDIAKHAFKSNKNYPLLFQIKWPRGIYRNQLYVSEEFINIINENNIQGFDFQQIWDSDQKLEKRLFWTIKNKEKDLYLISSQIVINGIKPYPIKKCILSSKQILWLCSELRKLKKNDIKNGINQLSHLTDDCALYVSISIFKEHANIVLNPLWNNKKLNGLENVLLPISLDSKNPLADNIEPFLLDLEYSIKKR